MNVKLVESIAQMIQSLNSEEKILLEEKLKTAVKTSENNQNYPSYKAATPQDKAKAFREWVNSHREINYPHLSDEDISRESIYGDRG